MQHIPGHEVLQRYQEALLARFPGEVQRLILFGSQARGEATPESDIDLLIVVNWDEIPLAEGFFAAPISNPRWQTMMEIAYDISLEYDVVLAPFVMSEQCFQRWSPLNVQIKREGIEIWRKN